MCLVRHLLGFCNLELIALQIISLAEVFYVTFSVETVVLLKVNSAQVYLKFCEICPVLERHMIRSSVRCIRTFVA